MQTPRLIAVAIAAVCATSVAPAQTAVSIDADDIGGTVTSAAGPEAGVWVIAETRDLDTRYAKIVVTDDQGRYVVPDLPQANYKVWVRGYGLADSPKVAATPGKSLDLTVARAAQRRRRRADLSGRVLVLDDEAARRSGSRASAGQAQRVPDVDEEHGVRRLPSDRQSRDAHDSAESRQVPSSREAWIRRIQSGQAGGQMTRTAMGQLARRAGEVPRRVDGSHRERRAARVEAAAAERRRTQHRRDGARLVGCESRTCTTCPARIGATRPSTRYGAAVRRAGAQHG